MASPELRVSGPGVFEREPCVMLCYFEATCTVLLWSAGTFIFSLSLFTSLTPCMSLSVSLCLCLSLSFLVSATVSFMCLRAWALDQKKTEREADRVMLLNYERAGSTLLLQRDIKHMVLFYAYLCCRKQHIFVRSSHVCDSPDYSSVIYNQEQSKALLHVIMCVFHTLCLARAGSTPRSNGKQSAGDELLFSSFIWRHADSAACVACDHCNRRFEGGTTFK